LLVVIIGRTIDEILKLEKLELEVEGWLNAEDWLEVECWLEAEGRLEVGG
jgi:hypothetical protein